MSGMDGRSRQASDALQSTHCSSQSLTFILQTSWEKGEETREAAAGTNDARGEHLLPSLRGSSADKQTPGNLKIDVLLPSPTGTSHRGSRPLLDCAVTIRNSWDPINIISASENTYYLSALARPTNQRGTSGSEWSQAPKPGPHCIHLTNTGRGCRTEEVWA